MPPVRRRARSTATRGTSGLSGSAVTTTSEGSVTTTATSSVTTAPNSVLSPTKPKMTMKTLQKQLTDLQETTNKLVNDLAARSAVTNNIPASDVQVINNAGGLPTVGLSNNAAELRASSAVSTATGLVSNQHTANVTSTVMGQASTIGGLPSATLATTSGAAGPPTQGLQGIQPVLTTTTPPTNVLPIYTAAAASGLRPPYLSTPGTTHQTVGLGTTLVSSILGTPSVNHTTTSNIVQQATTVSASSGVLPFPNLGNSPMQVGIHLPLDTGVSLATKEKIWKEQFVDLKTLLPNSRQKSIYAVNLETTSGPPTLTLASQEADNKQPLSLSQWMTAFAVYHYIYAQRHLARSPQLIAYSHLIRSMAERGARWHDYDVNFRQLRHTSPHLPWDNPHMQLYVDAFNNPAPSILAPKQSRPTPARDNKIPKGFCFRYHSPTEHCFVASCPFKHACPSCQGAHKAFLCPNRDRARPTHPRKH
ncbi:uncharacterized protein LOC144911024 [Branchiostoma floridae x Branchiostoma belcheri]